MGRQTLPTVPVLGTAFTRRAAFVAAEAIVGLEGFTRSSEFAHVYEGIICGQLSFDEAVKAILDESAARAVSQRSHVDRAP